MLTTLSFPTDSYFYVYMSVRHANLQSTGPQKSLKQITNHVRTFSGNEYKKSLWARVHMEPYAKQAKPHQG